MDNMYLIIQSFRITASSSYRFERENTSIKAGTTLTHHLNLAHVVCLKK